MSFLTHTPIEADAFVQTRARPTSGARVLFFGVCRGDSDGRRVLYLEYEAFEPVADARFKKILEEAFARWSLVDIQIQHRLGRVCTGEIAVAIAVETAHRAESYEASRFLIEQIKHRVPIWKKEFFEDGTSEWVLGCHYDELHHSDKKSSRSFETA